MENTNEFGYDGEDSMDDSDDDSIDSYVPPPPPSPKDQFKGLLGTIQRACEDIDAKYAQMIQVAQPFDKQLVVVLEGCKKADLAALQYVRSKMEAGQQIPQSLLVGLLGR